MSRQRVQAPAIGSLADEALTQTYSRQIKNRMPGGSGAVLLEPRRGGERSITMQMEKKRILKEDGRYLVYYHFPESASSEETQVYAAIDPTAAEMGKSADAPTTKAVEEQRHV